MVWTTLIIGHFIIDYQLVRFQLRTKLRTRQIIDNHLKSMLILDNASSCSRNLDLLFFSNSIKFFNFQLIPGKLLQSPNIQSGLFSATDLKKCKCCSFSDFITEKQAKMLVNQLILESKKYRG